MWSLILFFSNIELHILQEKESTDLDLESSIFNVNNLYKPSFSKLNLKDGIRKSLLFDIIIVVIKFFILFRVVKSKRNSKIFREKMLRKYKFIFHFG